MSSMLEQAIVDAKALREAALKNAEQAIIEKYAPEIKKAVNTLLQENNRKVKYEGDIYEVVSEAEDGKMSIRREGEKPHVVMESEVQEMSENEELLQEQEEMAPGGETADTGFQAPPAFNPIDTGEPAKYNSKIDVPVYEFNLMDFEPQQAEEAPAEEMGMTGLEEPIEAPMEEPIEGEEDPLAAIGDIETLQENIDEEAMMKEIMNILGGADEELLEEELIVDMGAEKDGTFQTNQATLEYQRDLELAKRESTQYKEENESLEKKLKELQENFKKLKLRNKQYKDVVEKINEKLNETLLSNAKLLYSNKTLSDASLNERQKLKIVEAIAKAKTPEEARSLCEALNATVTSGNDKKKSPRTLSESVQRKSNLSGILPRRNKPVSNEQHTFAEHMKKLAGIK